MPLCLMPLCLMLLRLMFLRLTLLYLMFLRLMLLRRNPLPKPLPRLRQYLRGSLRPCLPLLQAKSEESPFLLSSPRKCACF